MVGNLKINVTGYLEVRLENEKIVAISCGDRATLRTRDQGWVATVRSILRR
jgi:hypothetical protein